MSVLSSAAIGKITIAGLAGCSLVFAAGFTAAAAEVPNLIKEAVIEVTEQPGDEINDDELTEGELNEDELNDDESQPDPTEGDPAEGEEGEDDDSTPLRAVNGPDATGPSAYGLCNAVSNGGLPSHSTAFKALEYAAGEGGVDAYCEALPPRESDDSEDAEAEDDSAEATDLKKDKKDKKQKKDKKPGKKNKPGKR